METFYYTKKRFLKFLEFLNFKLKVSEKETLWYSNEEFDFLIAIPSARTKFNKKEVLDLLRINPRSFSGRLLWSKFYSFYYNYCIVFLLY